MIEARISRTSGGFPTAYRPGEHLRSKLRQPLLEPNLSRPAWPSKALPFAACPIHPRPDPLGQDPAFKLRVRRGDAIRRLAKRAHGI